MGLLELTLLNYVLVLLVNSIQCLPSLPPVHPAGKCPNGWYQYENNCYKVYGDNASDRTSWIEAKDKCRNLGRGYDLASIHSMGEQMFLTSLIPYHKYNLWIGMYSETQGIDVFKWSDNSSINFSYWMPHLLRSYWTNTCTWLNSDFYSAGRWNRTFCERERNNGYICKTKSVPNASSEDHLSSSLCKDRNFVEYNGACYNIPNDLKTWKYAEDTCTKLGGHLASVNSPYEHAFLYNYINNTKKVWLGFYDDKGYGLYRWTDNWPVLYTSWSKAEPNLGQGGQARCVFFDPITKGWKSTANCNQLNAFLCKKNKHKPPSVSYDKYDGKCPSHLNPRFDYGGRYCYHVSQMSWKSWGDASLYCFKQGGRLATFSSPEQSVMLWPQLGAVDLQLWVGLVKKYDGQFGWIDNRPLNFTNWYLTRFPEGDCVYVPTTDMKWRKDKCSEGFYFYQSLCMIKKDPL